MGSVFSFFFFQAEDGIRDLTVTGVQTCALPISHLLAAERARAAEAERLAAERTRLVAEADRAEALREADRLKIGRASGRGRGEISGVAGSLKKKKKMSIAVR